MPAHRDSLLPPDQTRAMFDRLSPRYDLANTVLSLGLDRWWRGRAVRELAPAGGGCYLDVGCGTGDAARKVLRQASGARVVGLDPVPGMLAVARARAQGAGQSDALRFVLGDAAALPFADGAFAGALAAFSFRNMPRRLAALREIRRVLTPGGRLVIVETSVPRNPVLRLGHWLYMHGMLPLLGWLVAGDAGAYRYLAASTEALPPPDRIVALLADAGFHAPRARPLTGGVVTLYIAHSP